ncbi:Hypothetical predicted protein [Lecanosticta acicola]|uniref:Uncharacterized protein n=1 Tax=Lecanosticta acicola TaxID=111012 RepID=A0AAI8YTR3_9PEZI|nr:Hypothetical predicted protein [Lecanosticta acicola]
MDCYRIPGAFPEVDSFGDDSLQLSTTKSSTSTLLFQDHQLRPLFPAMDKAMAPYNMDISKDHLRHVAAKLNESMKPIAPKDILRFRPTESRSGEKPLAAELKSSIKSATKPTGEQRHHVDGRLTAVAPDPCQEAPIPSPRKSDHTPICELHRSMIKGLRSQQTQDEARIAHLEKVLQQQDVAHQNLRTNLTDRERDIARLKHKLQMRTKERDPVHLRNQRLTSELEHKSAELDDYTRLLGDCATNIVELEEALATSEKSLRDKDKVIAMKNDAFEDLQACCETSRVNHKKTWDLFEARGVRMAALEIERAAAARDRDEAQKQVRNVTSDNLSLQKQVDELRAQNGALYGRLSLATGSFEYLRNVAGPRDAETIFRLEKEKKFYHDALLQLRQATSERERMMSLQLERLKAKVSYHDMNCHDHLACASTAMGFQKELLECREVAAEREGYIVDLKDEKEHLSVEIKRQNKIISSFTSELERGQKVSSDKSMSLTSLQSHNKLLHETCETQEQLQQLLEDEMELKDEKIDHLNSRLEHAKKDLDDVERKLAAGHLASSALAAECQEKGAYIEKLQASKTRNDEIAYELHGKSKYWLSRLATEKAELLERVRELEPAAEGWDLVDGEERKEAERAEDAVEVEADGVDVADDSVTEDEWGESEEEEYSSTVEGESTEGSTSGDDWTDPEEEDVEGDEAECESEEDSDCADPDEEDVEDDEADSSEYESADDSDEWDELDDEEVDPLPGCVIM